MFVRLNFLIYLKENKTMEIKVKKIDGGEFTAETDKTIEEIYKELSDNTGSSFILLGDRIEQKMTIESISKS